MHRCHPVGPCRLEADVTTRTAGILPAWREGWRQAGAPSERNSVRRRAAHPLSLARRQDMLSTRKSANFLPVGKDFTIPARYFLPVGMGLQSSPAKVQNVTMAGRAAHNRGKAVCTSKCPAGRDPPRLLVTPWRLRRTYSLLEVRVRGRAQSPIWRYSQVITSRRGNFPDAGKRQSPVSKRVPCGTAPRGRDAHAFLAAKIAWAPYKLPKAPTANNSAYRTASRQTSAGEIAWALSCP